MARAAALLVATVLLAGCAGTKSSAPKTTSTECRTPARVYGDLAALRAAGKIRVKNRLLGGPAMNRATDRFLTDLATARISNLTRNRLIDFAARSAVATCEQCFQALEAARPIPSIAHEGNGASC